MYIKMKKLVLGDMEMCKEEDDECKLLVDSGCTLIHGPKDKVEEFNKKKLCEFFIQTLSCTIAFYT